ncbi:O-methyltransferase [Zopfia rhizophila CBS 207.26]|uniref:O-methyltransferase n=1 Tax=Zopfia rhizophila CBS 207.26 TaxID=1314779 RepID=A0A6A6EVF5_9PEZI|nr:O-methyltransferase [Zopfia rhizophila CBS 207.26]
MNGTITTSNPQRVKSVSTWLEKIEKNTKIFLDYVSSKDLPEPSFESGDGLDITKPLPEEIAAAREAAVEATGELHLLLMGPLGLLLETAGDQFLLLGLQYILRHGIQYQVPLEGETTFAEIASACNLSEKDVTRILRLSMARHVLKEPQKGFVIHTAASRMLLHNAQLEAWIMNVAEEFWPSLPRLVDATIKWPESEEPNESGYSISHYTNENPFDVIKKDPKKQQQFIDAMSFSHLHPSFRIEHLLDNYDFGSIGKGTIVDVGGSHGRVSIEIAKKFPDVNCIVQDLPEAISGLDEHIPSDLKGRILGMEHDFLTPQPIRYGDIYLLRWILHDWSDKYCIKILQNLIPGLRKGSKIVINDICIPEPGQLGPRAERGLRIMDICMKSFNNARERDAETWEWLFSMADPRYQFKGITIPPEARMAIVEAEWSG